MAKFPNREAEVIELADEMISGYVANPGVFPSANVASLQAARAAYGTAKDVQTQAQAEAAVATEDKSEKLDGLEGVMHLELRKSEVDTVTDPEKLKMIGWAPKSDPTPSEPPGQPQSLKTVKEGAGTLKLNWDIAESGKGGKIRNYIVQRRELEGGQQTAWHTVGTAIDTEIDLEGQPRGVTMEYQVIGVNVGGEGDPSNIVDVVL